MLLKELPYQPDSSTLFNSIANEPYAIFLDSGHPYSDLGRFDILSANPKTILNSQNGRSIIEHHGELRISNQDPFSLLQEYLQPFEPDIELPSNLPFALGALGFWGYDVGRQYEKLSPMIDNDINLPDVFNGIYDWAVVVDHQQQKTYLLQQHEEIDESLRKLLDQKHSPHPSFVLKNSFRNNISKQQYLAAFSQIQQRLLDGDCYQVNLTQRFSTEFSGSAWNAYCALRQKTATPFAAYINHPKGQVLSFSPERFIKINQRYVTSQPIKGTIARSDNAEQDVISQQILKQSDKDHAENTMIVDVLRNDLAKNCLPGSVQVPNLCELHSFNNVHHLVSTVTGMLAPNKSSIDLLRDCLPGGSISGAPKISAMMIIEQLEAQRRSLYCGNIGYIDHSGNMDSSIAIRTLITSGNRIHCYSGGGIVVDSTPENEYEESLIKVNNLIKLLEQQFL